MKIDFLEFDAHNAEYLAALDELITESFIAKTAKFVPGFLKYINAVEDYFSPDDKYASGLINAWYFHSLFKRGGAKTKLMKSSVFKALNKNQKNFFELVGTQDAHLLFFRINADLGKDYYSIENELLEEEYILYSPILKLVIEDNPVGMDALFSTVVISTGKCLITYGFVVGYTDFDFDDLLFIATHIKGFNEQEELELFIERNPQPFMLLACYKDLPLLNDSEGQLIRLWIGLSKEPFVKNFAKGEIIQNYQEADGATAYLCEVADTRNLSIAIYDTHIETLMIYAMTSEEYELLEYDLKEIGYNLEEKIEISISPYLLDIIPELLNKEPNIPEIFLPYLENYFPGIDLNSDEDEDDDDDEDFEFEEEADDSDEDELEKMNLVVGEIVSYWNIHKKLPAPGIIAKKLNVSQDQVERIIVAMTKILMGE